MRRSIKIHHSKTQGFPPLEKIYYSELWMDPGVLSTTRFMLSSGSFMSVEFVPVANTIFSEDYFTMIDIHSIYKDGRVFFSTSPIPWESDAEVSWMEYKQRMIDYLSELLRQKLMFITGVEEYHAFCMKYNLRVPSEMKKYKGECQKLLREFSLLERVAEYNDRCESTLVSEDVVSEALDILSSYRKEPELQIRFMTETLEILPFSIVNRTVKSMGCVKRHQAVFLYYRLYRRSLQTGRYRTAFLYAINVSRLLKQGVNLEFEESMKSEAIDCLKDDKWSVVLRDVVDKIESFDSIKYGTNPNRLRRAQRHTFRLKAVDVEATDINKCADDTVLFNGYNTRIYFTDRFRINISFTQVFSAYLQGIAGKIIDTGEELFIPIHRVLNKTSASINVFADMDKMSTTIGDADEADVKLEKLVFSAVRHEPIDIRVTWIRRKSRVLLRAFESSAYMADEPERVSLLLDICDSDGFESRTIGHNIVGRNGNSISVSFEVSERVDEYVLHHEVSKGVFEVVRFRYPNVESLDFA